MDFQLVTEGLEFPEGPIAMADGSIILTEIKGQRLTRVTPDGQKETVVDTGGGPNGAALGPGGATYHTNNTGGGARRPAARNTHPNRGGGVGVPGKRGPAAPGPPPAQPHRRDDPALRPG